MSTTEKLKTEREGKTRADGFLLDRRVELVMSRTMRADLDRAARSEGASVAAVIRQAIKRHLRWLESEEKKGRGVDHSAPPPAKETDHQEI